jgi:hypothetical protein
MGSSNVVANRTIKLSSFVRVFSTFVDELRDGLSPAARTAFEGLQVRPERSGFSYPLDPAESPLGDHSRRIRGVRHECLIQRGEVRLFAFAQGRAISEGVYPEEFPFVPPDSERRL